MIVVDTSVWVSSLMERDVHFETSSMWLTTWVDDARPIHFPLLIIPELAGVLARYGMPLDDIAGEIMRMVDRPSFHLHEADLAMSLLAGRIAIEAGLKGADAVFVALAAWLGLPLVTWDRQQRERGGRFCRTMTPVDAREMI